jgi:sugar phosphate isomerase/epimerase
MSWHIGASTGCCQQTPIIDVIHALADAGIPAVEIGTPPGHFDMWQRSEVDAVQRALTATGVRAVAIHAPFGGLLDLSDPNPHHRNAGMGAILTAANVLRELGGKIVVAHATDIARHVGDAEGRLQRACASLRALHAACREIDMTLAIESPLPHLIGGAAQEFARLLTSVGDGARVCLDTGHVSLAGQWDAFAALARGRLVHLHAHDNAGHFDDHRPPGDGIIDWSRIADTLRALQFGGWVMLELACPTAPLRAYFSESETRLRALLGNSPVHAENRASGTAASVPKTP